MKVRSGLSSNVLRWLLLGEKKGVELGFVSWPHSSCRTRWRSICATELIPFIWLDNFGVGNLNAQACSG